ncbi:RES family NAD+ phosphorylase [Candidatus Blastococcus massiliensis]|uniref:RES family NAD+ phosphorylase n=1 Tax=Candidatus Blastococcus massiliensis TaxID=1470358 RepID=UPI0004AF85B6|nr:RES family NAD+ phosphorylase [Candidatus Blastococcus massiliensis]
MSALVGGGDSLARSVSGTFYRAVDPAHRAAALAGSRSAGRYSRADVPTLYLSASREGVAAAMIAHSGARSPVLDVLALEVRADRIVDLRAHEALRSIGIDPAQAAAEWQETVAAGGTPSSWRVREELERRGAHGLIDPSRRRPDLWHLVLFRWNRLGAPSVREIPG